MKNNWLKILLLTEASLCIVLSNAQASFAGFFTTTMAFPFEQIGLILRRLSLSGTAGNIAAVLIYATFCLTPVFILFLRRKKRGFFTEDLLLALLSAVLFVVLYYMINPGLAGFKRDCRQLHAHD